MKNKDEEIKKCKCSEECTCTDECNCNETCNCAEDCKCGHESSSNECNCDESHCGEEEILILKNNIEHLEAKIKLSQAELINYRKRKDEETSNMLKFANMDLIL